MTVRSKPKDREFDAIAKLVDLVLSEPDMEPATWDFAIEAARVALPFVSRERAAKAAADAQRAARATPKKAKPYRADPPELVAAKAVVRNRSGGYCEVKSDVCDRFARHVHHTARRKGKGSHAPELLLDACEPCHLEIHANPELSYERGWLVHDFAVAPVTDTKKGNR